MAQPVIQVLLDLQENGVHRGIQGIGEGTAQPVTQVPQVRLVQQVIRDLLVIQAQQVRGVTILV
jgi:hypothetical protein